MNGSPNQKGEHSPLAPLAIAAAAINMVWPEI